MKKKIKYEGEIEISIPDDTLQEMLKDFRMVIIPDANINDLFLHIVHNIIYCASDFVDFVEGIGKVGVEFEIESYDKPDLELLDEK